MTSHSSRSLSTTSDLSSDDEIVWNIDQSSSTDPLSDDDFVVLSRPRSYGSGLSSLKTVNQATYYAEEVLVSRLSRLALNEFPSSAAKTLSIGRADVKTIVRPANKPSAAKNKKKKKGPTLVHASASKSYPSPAASPIHDRLPPTVTLTHRDGPKRAKKCVVKFRAPATGTGLGFRPIVDDISEKASDNGEDIGTLTVHEQAVKYITSFLANPEAKNSVCRLTLLQSLIIELGLASCTPIIPGSLKAARALLKSRAFVNIREYLAVRDQGQAALQRVMHPNRMSLIKDIRTKRNPASLKWVKRNGLQVFLVTCFP